MSAAPRDMFARYAGTCRTCLQPFDAGDPITYAGRGLVFHPGACTDDRDPAQRGSTTRERREARAERLAEWADKREARGTAELEQARARASLIPFGQPILVGHHSERGDRNYRAKIGAGYDRGFENLAKADDMRSRSQSIANATERAIFSDDPDAIERLTARIADLESERARIKAFNKSCRATLGGNPELLDARQRADLESTRRCAAWQIGKRGEFPAYVLSNLGGNIRRQAQRLAQLQRAAQRDSLTPNTTTGETE